TDLSVARAEVVDGSIAINDLRSGDFVGASSISGEIRVDALRGPFGFQGEGRYGDALYSARLSSSAIDDLGGMQLSVYLQPKSEGFSLNAEGRLATGPRPGFAGDVSFR